MSRSWILDSSPLIVLSRAGRLDLLEGAGVELIIPAAVEFEVLQGHSNDPARRLLETGWGNRLALVTVPVPVLEWGLGVGESSVIAAALQNPASVAILDDAGGRACARAVGVRVLGTLGIVLQAVRAGRLNSATPAIQDLRAAGLYLDDVLIRRVLKEVLNEEW